jgi:hypothetical protein
MIRIRNSRLNAHCTSTSSLEPSLLDLHLISISSVATIATSASAKEEPVKQIRSTSSGSDTLHAAAIFPTSHAAGSETKV